MFLFEVEVKLESQEEHVFRREHRLVNMKPWSRE